MGRVADDPLGVVLWGVGASFLFDDGGRCGGQSVDRNVYPLRVSWVAPVESLDCVFSIV